MNTTQLPPPIDKEYNNGTSADVDNRPTTTIKMHWAPSREFVQVFDTTMTIVVAGIISVFGVMTNTINIIVFYRQGPMSSSPTLILTGLAVSDFTVCMFGMSQVFLKILEWYVGRVLFGWYVQHLYVVLSNRPLSVMIQTTCWTMALLTLERAISVTFPFKVKAIFTPRRSLAILVVNFVLSFVFYFPTLAKFKPTRYTAPFHPVEFRGFNDNEKIPESLQDASSIISEIILRTACIFIVVFCSVIITWKVKSSQRFRKSKASTTADVAAASQSHTQENNSSQAVVKKTTPKGNYNPSSKDIKDRKMLRMITVVAGVFLFCYSFVMLDTVISSLVFKPHVHYNVYVGNMIADVLTLLEYFNSSINAVIYFNMSARYKEELLILCGKKTR